MRVETIIQRLEGVRPNGNGYMARCPAHNDRLPSLSIQAGHGGRILIKCFAGCSTPDVMAAMGLRLSDLFADKKPSRRYGRRARCQ